MNHASSSTPAPSSKQRVLSIQLFRGVAALLVVLLHLHNIERKYYASHWMGSLQYGWIGVDLFFVISGVVISLVTVGKFGNFKNAAVFLYHRFARIYPTFWFYYAIVLVAFLYNPSLINATSGHHADLIRSFLLIPSRWDNLVGPAWTLSYELNFYLAFFVLLILAPERWVPHYLTLWAALIVVINVWFPVPGHSYILWTATNPFVLEFLLGCLLFRIYRKRSFPSFVGLVSIVLAFAWMAGLIVWTDVAHGSDSTWLKNAFWLRPIACGLFAFLLLLGAMIMERQGRLRIARPLCALGDWSYSIYLSHEMICEFFGRVLHRWLPRQPYSILIVAAVALPTVVLTGYLSYTLIEHPLMVYLYKRATLKGRMGVPVSQEG